MKKFCLKCGRVFKGWRSQMLCDLCLLEEYQKLKKEKRNNTMIKKPFTMQEETSVTTPEEETPEESQETEVSEEE